MLTGLQCTQTVAPLVTLVLASVFCSSVCFTCLSAFFFFHVPVSAESYSVCVVGVCVCVCVAGVCVCVLSVCWCVCVCFLFSSFVVIMATFVFSISLLNCIFPIRLLNSLCHNRKFFSFHSCTSFYIFIYFHFYPSSS